MLSHRVILLPIGNSDIFVYTKVILYSPFGGGGIATVRSTTLFAVRQHRFVSASGTMLTKRSNDVASKLANDVVSCGHKHKKKDTTFIVSFFL